MKKILVAEDDKFLANAYRLKLEKSGFEIEIAYDGNETMKILESFKPDIIILDLVMPVKDGFSVLEDLKDKPDLNKIPVIIASNLGQKEDIDRGMKLGAKDYIVKANMAIDDLLKRIKKLL